MTKVSIEYAHIYTNQHITDEHKLSVEVLNEVETSAKSQGKDVSLVVMVDEYSFPDPTFDYASFSKWLKSEGYGPDLLFRESQLIPVCDNVLSLMENHELKSQIIDYIKAKKYPCSLFIAAWYLMRLGKIESALFPSYLISDELINILPESFKPFEDMGLEIIASTPYADVVTKIHYKFLPGRLIA